MTPRPLGGPRSAARAILVLTALVAALMVAPSGASAGTLIADNGFRPAPNGFSFPNYGNEGQAGLNAAEFERLYGPQVCINANARQVRAHAARPGDDEVLQRRVRRRPLLRLRHPLRAHLQGLPAALRLLESRSRSAPAASTPSNSGIAHNRLLQRSITRAFDFQNLESINDNTIIGTPKRDPERPTARRPRPEEPGDLDLRDLPVRDEGRPRDHPVRGRKDRPR